MKAPDKIYITPVGTYDTKHIPDLQDNIYISKDYLLEWAEGEMKHHRDSVEYYSGWNMAIAKLINKLNEI